ncbi:MAG TPA: hypothetical protein VGO40_19335, partial [Longimicrobium sp.]|nr:hypothetical protein [Longimicrobium sp.]
MKEELLTKSERAFRTYYSAARQKYGVAKTLLYRMQPVPIYDFYVHLGLSPRRRGRISTEQVETPLSSNRHIIVTGTAGCGKSTLLKHFFLNSLDTRWRLPVFV